MDESLKHFGFCDFDIINKSRNTNLSKRIIDPYDDTKSYYDKGWKHRTITVFVFNR